MTEIERLQMNANQANSDFVAIKGKIVEKGVEVAEGTRTAEYASKVDEVYEKGKQAQYDEFWDTIQNNGKRVFYKFAFCYWMYEYIRPKHKVTTVDGDIQSMFLGASKLKKVEKEYFSFSPTSTRSNNYMFLSCTSLLIIEDIGLFPCQYNYGTFQNCQSLHTIEAFRVSEDSIFDSTFLNCFSLENLTIEGTIGQKGLNLQYSTKLSKASWISIINALSSTATGKSITGSLESVKRAFETSAGAMDGDASAEWLGRIADKANWTINLI
jgi:hypothetical protein